MSYIIKYERVLWDGRKQMASCRCFDKSESDLAVAIYKRYGYQILSITEEADNGKWFSVRYFVGHDKHTQRVYANSETDAAKTVRNSWGHNSMYNGIISVTTYIKPTTAKGE